MKAIVHHRYGSADALTIEEVARPVPGPDQVLVEVHAASLNALDWHLLSADMFLVRLMGGGLFKPKEPRLGHDLAGRVAAIGNRVTRLRPGDEVFGSGAGALAEYACANEAALVPKPATMTFETAAAVPIAALTALQALRDHGKIRPEQTVLIQGASGGVGTFAVQIAKTFGAEVTAVCSTRNLDVASSIGADHVVDYTREDFTRNGQRYDLILAVNGYRSLRAYRRVLSPTGRYVLVGAPAAYFLPAVLQARLPGRWISATSRQKMGFMGMAKMDQQDLQFVGELVESGKVVPVVDRCFPFEQTAEAFRYFSKVHPKGKVIIRVKRGNDA